MKKRRFFFILLPFFIGFFAFLFKAYFKRIGAFGCFDDCSNFIAGYFILKGKALYSQIFFNHQPLIAYLSYFIQALLQPKTIYKLVLYHRLFIFLFSFLMDFLLILRFKWIGIGFTLFYETTKYYLFGDRFLGEAVIAYPLVYLLGLIYYRFQKKKVYFSEYLLAAFFAWLVIFTRAPYIAVAVFLYLSLIATAGKNFRRVKILSLAIFGLLSAILLLQLPLKDYFFNIVTVNRHMIAAHKFNLFKIFGYPIYILIGGRWFYFRRVLTGLDITFLILIILKTIRSKRIKQSLFFIAALGLTAIRWLKPGFEFYQAFYLLPWYALLIMAVFLLLEELFAQKKFHIFAYGLICFLIILFSYTVLSRQYFIYEKIDKNSEFTTGYGHYFAFGQLIKFLANANNTLFIERKDDLIYWQANLPSAYRYSWYTSSMPLFPRYNQARKEMFRKHPPDFYYSDCSHLPLIVQPKAGKYQQIYFANNPSCLYVKKTILKHIPKEKWAAVKKLGFHQ